ncbi:MAG: radical SAM protein [Candidatus Lokiarchaeota archaeon]|nr:radical SAM protein [Candidatus Lokiarchaeota archaeon]
MNKTQLLLDKVESGLGSWLDFTMLLNLDSSDLEPVFTLAQKITRKNFGNYLKIYIPTKRFPAISITGTECALECEHCNKKYLHGMKQILNTKELEQFLFNLSKKNGVGALISGGSTVDGSVPLLNFLDTIKKVKRETDLIINTHTGLLNEETAKKLAEANVDIVSFDINMDEEVVRNVYHLDIELSEYKKAINLLKKYDLNIVPHICIGLHYGKLKKELESIKFIKETKLNPSLIVIIVLIPPKESKIKFELPKPEDIAKVITILRIAFPKTEISLGCMRPRGKIKTKIEKVAIKAGITRIEIPSKDTLKWLKNYNSKIQFKFFSACCAIPDKFEKLAESNKSDIKRYTDI